MLLRIISTLIRDPNSLGYSELIQSIPGFLRPSSPLVIVSLPSLHLTPAPFHPASSIFPACKRPNIWPKITKGQQKGRLSWTRQRSDVESTFKAAENRSKRQGRIARSQKKIENGELMEEHGGQNEYEKGMQTRLDTCELEYK
jgi:hypothetical protein